ncbi:hypothetical protein MACH09_11840 [Vibrio sp. MACH09]|uniref:hypothetical protein n=1 Tax=Vibrio sp. MACH09 TaxID=3025122 RepID=UPI002792BC3F|nr:hypothetical protein [Vibrio sp. MACH09]GLO60676.1 hypothetical protein MACH09_11840 [Vibrio sp. MACH09]
MLTVIRRLFVALGSRSLARYYQSRLERSKTTLERYTQSLMSLYEMDESSSEEEQK